MTSANEIICGSTPHAVHMQAKNAEIVGQERIFFASTSIAVVEPNPQRGVVLLVLREWHVHGICGIVGKVWLSASTSWSLCRDLRVCNN